MNTTSIFSDVNICRRHTTTAVAAKIAGGKSFLSNDMFDAAHLANDNGPAWIADIDRFIDANLVNMFERDAGGNPCIESNVIKAALRKAAVQLGQVTIVNPIDDNATNDISAVKFIDKAVKIVENQIKLLDDHNGSELKYGQLMPIEFRDADGFSKLRYVEVFHDVCLNFTIEAIHATNAWPALWRLAEQHGLGGARFHGYGKFVIVDWS